MTDLIIPTEEQVDKLIENVLPEFRRLLKRLYDEPGVEVCVPYAEITQIVALAVGRPAVITVTSDWDTSARYML